MTRRRSDRGLVGVDLSGVQLTGRRRIPPGLIAGALIAGFCLAALRVQITELGYALADAQSRESALQEERRVLTAHLEELRTPSRLSSLASERGFGRPEVVIDLSTLLLAAAEGTRP